MNGSKLVVNQSTVQGTVLLVTEYERQSLLNSAIRTILVFDWQVDGRVRMRGKPRSLGAGTVFRI